MSELLPCPFCGGEAELKYFEAVDPPEECADTCDECGCCDKGDEFWAICHHCGNGIWRLDFDGGCHDTEAEAIAAWNTRVPMSYEDVKILLDELGLSKLTCHWELEHSGTLYDKWRCSKCGYLFVEPLCDQGYTDLEPNYCPNCGAKVMG